MIKRAPVVPRTVPKKVYRFLATVAIREGLQMVQIFLLQRGRRKPIGQGHWQLREEELEEALRRIARQHGCRRVRIRRYIGRYSGGKNEERPAYGFRFEIE